MSIFLLPDDPLVMTRLIEAIPFSWSWMSGALYAPEPLLNAGTANQGSMIRISRHSSVYPIIDSAVSRGDYGTPDEVRSLAKMERREDLLAILAEYRLPGCIVFERAGESGHEGDYSLEMAEKIACAWVERGYRGRLSFYSGESDYGESCCPAVFTLYLRPWENFNSRSLPSTTMQPPMVQAAWYEQYGGTLQVLEPLVELCRHLMLKELSPAEMGLG